ncbi:Asp-tRNA(Asn)/Glu-tRNA(Gln) amidotransferase subunit GatB [Candidatus Woesearchaeota archaeon]|nr:Asp-tRNA(Asn)/Glu-tRNA(Gln) amidotransferase subunit GatB [Candidatus Woesearchaeota archaeon]MBT4368088.1 Asp-tRNA(Asn)/Glu-tRNA(Gln) amidotransferase subunit GatB [Candidatus Woesearchaeota archaeon]MBT4712576.1 Asp-tRNA(Asn)/Glu-tRNA(Gln) amidotransferase subunit GatB [Candidatus Woesearchaeota archaeon]MBT6639489.1 Asp-tRNA(Asn)/Glu-tRNA(Gln) amidotransferase subunit GatB [Candidatus Woesearchaeota archaeon]MBT7133661.1 Asp-tRNA(Asn)/Glu-tRNA(Gln) amidotransferase subunit GatB [Candidatu
MNFTSDIVIGLEIHVQLNTKTKLFCSCPTQGSEEPNTRTCEVCLGMPGSKPVLNKAALEYALKLALALECEISSNLTFSRKSYFYPDLAKNYQISQYEIPLGIKGKLHLKSGKTIGITRVHMEEDPAALVHPNGMVDSKFVLIDYNRSGNPLCEVVTEPELTSPDEARDFMKQLIAVLNYLKIFDQDNCIIKADANISIKEKDYTRVEIKNITGFKEIERALNYELERQKREDVVQETRAWDAETGVTRSLRKKETEEEYGYIIDPDLTTTKIEDSLINKIKQDLPELARDKALKFVEKHKIREEDALVLSQEKELAELFEKAVEHVSPTLAVSWIRHELNRVLNYNKKSLEEVKLDEVQLINLLKLIEKKTITENVAQKILEKLIEESFDVEDYVKENKLNAVSDSGELKTLCEEAIKESSKAVEDYKSGNEKAFHAIVGVVMRKTRGAANPAEVQKIIKELLE